MTTCNSLEVSTTPGDPRVCGVDEALDAYLRPHQTIFVVGDLAEPTTLTEALLPRLEHLAPLTIISQFVGGRCRFADDDYADQIHIQALFPTRRLADRMAS